MSELRMPEPCPNEAAHENPVMGYVEWQEWAEAKGITHDCVRCEDCGLFVIWVERATFDPTEGLTP